MITLDHIYILMGALFAVVAALSLRDRANKKRFGNAIFWALFAASFLFGSHLSDVANGVLVLALVIVGGFNFIGRTAPPTTSPEQRRDGAQRYGNGLFYIALIIPLVALIGTLFLKDSGFVDPRQVTLISLGLGVIVALAVGYVWMKPPALAPFEESRRLADTIGWAALLPQLLASLGAVFAAGGVGREVGIIATQYLPLGTPFAAVATYCIGMALFTIIMGNAFAAFPVMTAAIGLPLVVAKFHGDVTIMAAIGMLAGYCGTLATPMAANFNIVPAALLEIPDYAVIRAQIPTAIPLLAVNIILMYVLAFRF
ncbi:MAG: DUF979 domain-containing protein [Proteobacteria bacterium]|nr:DUF979 domain-containing protein [Pseudomonadota bacterium]